MWTCRQFFQNIFQIFSVAKIDFLSPQKLWPSQKIITINEIQKEMMGQMMMEDKGFRDENKYLKREKKSLHIPFHLVAMSIDIRNCCKHFLQSFTIPVITLWSFTISATILWSSIMASTILLIFCNCCICGVPQWQPIFLWSSTKYN